MGLCLYIYVCITTQCTHTGRLHTTSTAVLQRKIKYGKKEVLLFWWMSWSASNTSCRPVLWCIQPIGMSWTPNVDVLCCDIFWTMWKWQTAAWCSFVANYYPLFGTFKCQLFLARNVRDMYGHSCDHHLGSKQWNWIKKMKAYKQMDQHTWSWHQAISSNINHIIGEWIDLCQPEVNLDSDS